MYKFSIEGEFGKRQANELALGTGLIQWNLISNPDAWPVAKQVKANNGSRASAKRAAKDGLSMQILSITGVFTAA